MASGNVEFVLFNGLKDEPYGLLPLQNLVSKGFMPSFYCFAVCNVFVHRRFQPFLSVIQSKTGNFAF